MPALSAQCGVSPDRHSARVCALCHTVCCELYHRTAVCLSPWHQTVSLEAATVQVLYCSPTLLLSMYNSGTCTLPNDGTFSLSPIRHLHRARTLGHYTLSASFCPQWSDLLDAVAKLDSITSPVHYVDSCALAVCILAFSPFVVVSLVILVNSGSVCVFCLCLVVALSVSTVSCVLCLFSVWLWWSWHTVIVCTPFHLSPRRVFPLWCNVLHHHGPKPLPKYPLNEHRTIRCWQPSPKCTTQVAAAHSIGTDRSVSFPASCWSMVVASWW